MQLQGWVVGYPAAAERATSSWQGRIARRPELRDVQLLDLP